MTETGIVFEWRIQNLSHWSSEVHGKSIKSPEFYFGNPLSMELYPKGVSGQDEHLVVHICGSEYPFSGELSFYSSEGTLLCTQPVDAKGNEDLEFPPGPEFDDVLSRIRDFITLRLRINTSHYRHHHMRTAIEVLKTSVKINPRWIIPSFGIYNLCYILLSPRDTNSRMRLYSHSKDNAVQFDIEPPNEFEYPFAVDVCMRLTRSDGTVDSCVRKEHVFHDNDPWTFPPNPLQKEELAGKDISLCLYIKTRNPISMICCGSYTRDVSINPMTILGCNHSEPSSDPNNH